MVDLEARICKLSAKLRLHLNGDETRVDEKLSPIKALLFGDTKL